MPSKSRKGGGPAPDPDDLELGYISGIFGIKGEVKLFLFNPESAILQEPRTVKLLGTGGVREVSMSSRPGAGKRILGRIEGVTTPEAARELMDLRIFVPRASLPELDDDEFYDWQLLNAEVWIDGEVVGRIVQIHHPGPIEVFEIDLGQSEPLFVPSTAEHVLHIDVEAPSVTLQPDALMDDPEDPDAL